MAKADPKSIANEWPAEGLSPIEAIKRIAGAERWQEYLSARKAASTVSRVAPGHPYTVDEQARLERLIATYEAAFGPLLDAWARGELELWARRGDPTTPPELIQPIAQSYMRWQLDHGNFRIENAVFRNALFRLSSRARPAAASTRITEALLKAKWLRDAVQRRVSAGGVPRGITEFSRQLAEEMKASGLHPYKARTIENRLREWELWPVRTRP